MAYVCCNDYFLLIGLCKTIEEWNYKAIFRLTELIGWKYEKKIEKAFTLLLIVKLWVYVSFILLYNYFSIQNYNLAENYHFFVYLGWIVL